MGCGQKRSRRPCCFRLHWIPSNPTARRPILAGAHCTERGCSGRSPFTAPSIGILIRQPSAISQLHFFRQRCLHDGAHLRDFPGRGGRARILVGDYLDVTEPTALRRLRPVREYGCGYSPQRNSCLGTGALRTSLTLRDPSKNDLSRGRRRMHTYKGWNAHRSITGNHSRRIRLSRVTRPAARVSTA